MPMSTAVAAVTRRCPAAIMSIIWWTATYTIRMATIATISRSRERGLMSASAYPNQRN
jgi:hypothetical protein